MSFISEIKEQLESGLTLKFISNIFTEINATKIKKIRASFEKNRRFYDEITYAYQSIKVIANKSGFTVRKGEIVDLETAKKTKISTLLLAITSNSHFYGALNLNVAKKVKEDWLNLDADKMVIGQTGIEYLNSFGLKGGFQEIRLQKDYPNRQEVSQLVEKTKSYDRVLVYFPSFVTLLTQKVGVLDITQTPASKGGIKALEEEKIVYIFEPELEKILVFFEKQIRSLLFVRSILESELSRTAARLLSMNNAQQRAEDLVKTKKRQLTQASRSVSNARLLETFSGISMWNNQ